MVLAKAVPEILRKTIGGGGHNAPILIKVNIVITHKSSKSGLQGGNSIMLIVSFKASIFIHLV